MKPRISGLACACRICALSAPSANNLIFSSEILLTALSVFVFRIQSTASGSDPTRSVRGRLRGPFGVSAVDQDGFASGVRAGINVAPAIADHVTVAQIDPVLLRRALYQPWSRLAAVAVVRIIMVAGQHVVQRQLGTQAAVDLLDRFALSACLGRHRADW